MTVAATLSARGEGGLTRSMRGHTRDCRRCGADVADHATYRDAVAALGRVEYVAPPEIMPRVMADVGPWIVPAPAPARAGLNRLWRGGIMLPQHGFIYTIAAGRQSGHMHQTGRLRLTRFGTGA